MRRFSSHSPKLGFSLKEISQIVALGNDATGGRAIAADKLLAVRSKITHLVVV